jgi:hypothetical protein
MLSVARIDIAASRMDAGQRSVQFVVVHIQRSAVCHDNRGSAGSPMRSRVGQKLPFPLESQAERRRHNSVPDPRQMVKRIMKTKRIPYHEKRAANLNGLVQVRQVRRGTPLRFVLTCETEADSDQSRSLRHCPWLRDKVLVAIVDVKQTSHCCASS